MSGVYRGWHARAYHVIWRGYTARTLGAVGKLVDWTALQAVPDRLGRPPRVLDVGCGTGALLRQMLVRVPGLEATGVDASADMLTRARATLATWPDVRLERVWLAAGPTANLPFDAGSFDLITCANVVHYLAEPVAVLAGLARLLALGGQLVIEDFARRAPPFPWPVFEGLLRRLDRQHVRTYTLGEAGDLCARAGLRVVSGRAFAVDWLWHAWALSGSRRDRDALVGDQLPDGSWRCEGRVR